MKFMFHIELTHLTVHIVGKVAKTFPAFIQKVPKLLRFNTGKLKC